MRPLALLLAALAFAGCATAPDAGKLSEARALESKGDLPGAVGAYEGAYAVGCSFDKPSVPCRDALLHAADATLQSGRPRSAIGKYQLALRQLPHDADSDSVIKSRIDAANTAIDRQRDAAQSQPRCPVTIAVHESVGKRLQRAKGALSLDGAPLDVTQPYSAPLLAMEHELALDFAYRGKTSLDGYTFKVASNYTFVCPKGQPLKIVVNLVSSRSGALQHGVEAKFEVSKAH